MDREATSIINVPSSDSMFLVVKSEWVNALVSSELGALNDCYNAEISKNFKEFIPIEQDVGFTEFESDEYLKESDILRL